MDNTYIELFNEAPVLVSSFLLVIALAVVIGGGIFIYFKFFNGTKLPSNIRLGKTKEDTENYKKLFYGAVENVKTTVDLMALQRGEIEEIKQCTLDNKQMNSKIVEHLDNISSNLNQATLVQNEMLTRIKIQRGE